MKGAAREIERQMRKEANLFPSPIRNLLLSTRYWMKNVTHNAGEIEAKLMQCGNSVQILFPIQNKFQFLMSI